MVRSSYLFAFAAVVHSAVGVRRSFEVASATEFTADFLGHLRGVWHSFFSVPTFERRNVSKAQLFNDVQSLQQVFMKYESNDPWNATHSTTILDSTNLMVDTVQNSVNTSMDTLQGIINQKLISLASETLDAVGALSDAIDADRSWYLCVLKEKQDLSYYYDNKTIWDRLTSDHATECSNEKVNAAGLIEIAAPASFTCNHKLDEEGFCENEYESYAKDLLNWTDDHNSSVYRKLAAFDQLRTRCLQLKIDINTAMGDTNHAWAVFEDSRSQCTTGARDSKFCDFLWKRQDMCGIRGDYLNLITDAEAPEGAHSVPEMQEEWTLSSLTRCLVLKMLNQIQVTKDVFETCESEVDFVNYLDWKNDTFQNNFINITCQETAQLFHDKAIVRPSSTVGIRPESYIVSNATPSDLRVIQAMCER